MSEPSLRGSNVHVNKKKPGENNYMWSRAGPHSPLRFMVKCKARPSSPARALCVHVIHQFRGLTVSAISTEYGY